MKPFSRRASSRTHALGQNFLVDIDIADRIVEAASLKPGDAVLEIGPGRGILTNLLAQTGANILAVEKDASLTRVLIPQFSDFSNIRFVNGDIRTFDYHAYFQNTPFVVVANLPYSVGTHVVRMLLEQTPKPQQMVVMLQKEVAERMTARPPHMSLLSQIVQIFAETEMLFDVHKESFSPKPQVESSVLRLTTRKTPLVETAQYVSLLRFMKAGFANKRKTLENSLSGSLQKEKEEVRSAIAQAQLNAAIRAEALTLEQWITLQKILNV